MVPFYPHHSLVILELQIRRMSSVRWQQSQTSNVVACSNLIGMGLSGWEGQARPLNLGAEVPSVPSIP